MNFKVIQEQEKSIKIFDSFTVLLAHLITNSVSAQVFFWKLTSKSLS